MRQLPQSLSAGQGLQVARSQLHLARSRLRRKRRKLQLAHARAEPQALRQRCLRTARGELRQDERRRKLKQLQQQARTEQARLEQYFENLAVQLKQAKQEHLALQLNSMRCRPNKTARLATHHR